MHTEATSNGDSPEAAVMDENISENSDSGAVGDSILDELTENVRAAKLTDDDDKTAERHLSSVASNSEEDAKEKSPLAVPEHESVIPELHSVPPIAPKPPNFESDETLFEDPSDEDDGEGDWITPDNIDSYKTRALNLFPSSDSTDTFTTVGPKRKNRKPKHTGPVPTDENTEPVAVGCMTADFAMQNVLLQLGLNLVGTEGKRIQKVKTWVLRCHACFK